MPAPIAARLMWPLSLRVMFGPAQVPAHFQREFPVWFALRPKQLRAAAAEILLATPSVLRLARRYRELQVPTVLVGQLDGTGYAGAGFRRLAYFVNVGTAAQTLPSWSGSRSSTSRP